jgi:glycosyltransferase involved in cell wall biosynthesis
MILSILIPTLRRRNAQLRLLLDAVYSQQVDGVEVLLDIDDGEDTVGKKRQRLLSKARGEFVAHIDDDDRISPTYVSKILSAIEKNPDVVGLTGIITTEGLNPKKFIHTMQCKTWYEHENCYYRNPNHLNPVKRELALQVGFKDINCGEDKDYSDRLLPLLKTEVFIPETLYYYQFSNKNTATQNR